MSATLFLSTVTKEFGGLRARLARLLQRTKRVHVRHQDDFAHRGAVTLQMLEEEIRESELVIHVIGALPGAEAPKAQVEEFLARHPEFSTRFPAIAAAGRAEAVSYTQWEAWLALFFRKRLCSYAIPGADAQAKHIERLRAVEQYPKQADDADAAYDEIILSLLNLNILTRDEIERPVSLPYASLGTLFKGREEFLGTLRESLLRTDGTHATAIVGKTVHGLGGVGKTRLAVEYAWQHLEDYSAVLFVAADSPAIMRQKLAALAGIPEFKLSEADSPEEPVRVAAVLRWLNKHPGWLLIIDNVDSEEAASFVEHLLTEIRGGHVLITSRLNRWEGNPVAPLELGVLSPPAAEAFLLERTATGGGRTRVLSPSDKEDAAGLARDLDGLALALEQAAAYIVASRIFLAEYRRRWASHDREVQEWYSERQMKYPRSVATTWRTTLDQLGPGEISLLNLLAWFAPDPIPLFVFENEKAEDIWREAIKLLSAGSSVSRGLRASLTELADFSMISWNSETNSVAVHRVVQEVLRTQVPDQKRAEWAKLSLLLLDAAPPPRNPGDVRTWPHWEPLRPHVEFAAWETDRLDIAEPTSTLMGYLGQLLSAKALHKQAERLERRALAIDERHFGIESPQVALRLNNLAITLQATNRLSEAESLMRRALAIDEASFGADHPSVARDLNNLAALLQSINRLAEAEPLMRRMVEILLKFNRINKNPHPHLPNAFGNYAHLLNAMGKSDDEIGRILKRLSNS